MEEQNMSDVAATNCGCEHNNCGSGVSNNWGFGNGCNSIIWIILLLSFCGNGNSWGNNNGCGCGSDSCCILIILLLLCGNGCGNNNGCGCSLC